MSQRPSRKAPSSLKTWDERKLGAGNFELHLVEAEVKNRKAKNFNDAGMSPGE